MGHWGWTRWRHPNRVRAQVARVARRVGDDPEALVGGRIVERPRKRRREHLTRRTRKLYGV